MEKIFYITKSLDSSADKICPRYDRFKRVEKLNMLLDSGWSIKNMQSDGQDTFFVLEKKG